MADSGGSTLPPRPVRRNPLTTAAPTTSSAATRPNSSRLIARAFLVGAAASAALFLSGGGDSSCNFWSEFWSRFLLAPRSSDEGDEQWDHHGLPVHSMARLGELSDSKKYKVACVVFFDRSRDEFTEGSETPFFELVAIRPEGVYTRLQLEQELKALNASEIFETLELDAQMFFDGTVGLRIAYRERMWPEAARFRCINVEKMPQLKPVEVSPDLTEKERSKVYESFENEYRHRILSSMPCLLPVSLQAQIVQLLMRKGILSAGLLLKIRNYVEYWYHSRGYTKAHVVNFKILKTREVVCEVVEGKIVHGSGGGQVSLLPFVKPGWILSFEDTNVTGLNASPQDDRRASSSSGRRDGSALTETVDDWSSLPLDILDMILSKMCASHFHDVASFRGVCRHWHGSSYPRDLGIGSQWLVDAPARALRLAHPLIDRSLVMDFREPELYHFASPLCSNGGWLLMREESRHFFFSPCSRLTIKLPELPHPDNYSFTSYAFDSTPDSDDCMVFALAVPLDCYSKTCIFTISRGESSWTELIWLHDHDFFPSSSSPVFISGSLYVIDCFGLVGAFSRDTGSLLIQRFPYKLVERDDRGRYYLLSFSGRLIGVHIGIERAEITVCELDLVNLTWHDVTDRTDLGEFSFFLSDAGSCFAGRCTRASMMNKLFLPRFVGAYMVFYSFDERLFRTFDNDVPIETFNATSRLMECCWMVPENHDKTRRNVWMDEREQARAEGGSSHLIGTIESEVDANVDYPGFFGDLTLAPGDELEPGYVDESSEDELE